MRGFWGFALAGILLAGNSGCCLLDRMFHCNDCCSYGDMHHGTCGGCCDDGCSSCGGHGLAGCCDEGCGGCGSSCHRSCLFDFFWTCGCNGCGEKYCGDCWDHEVSPCCHESCGHGCGCDHGCSSCGHGGHGGHFASTGPASYGDYYAGRSSGRPSGRLSPKYGEERIVAGSTVVTEGVPGRRPAAQARPLRPSTVRQSNEHPGRPVSYESSSSRSPRRSSSYQSNYVDQSW